MLVIFIYSTANAASAATFTYPPAIAGTVTAPAIDEASGLVASRSNANVLWTHNDDGGPILFALSTTGQLLGTYSLTGATNTDWEDISIGAGPEPGVDYLYVTNSASGGNVRVTRIPEPSVYAAQQAPSPLTKTVPGAQDQVFSIAAPDVESMFIDPVDGDLYLGSKENTGSAGAKFFRATQSQFGAVGTQAMTQIATLAIPQANGASISPSGNEILVRNQTGTGYMFHRAPGQTVTQALNVGPPPYETFSVHPTSVEPNAEAIAFDAYGNNFYTISEQRGPPGGPFDGPILYHYARTSNDGPVIPTTLVAAASDWKYLDGNAVRSVDWNQPGANDGSWASGSGPFGFGQGNEQTILSFGGNPASKAASYEFRKTFEIDPIMLASELTLKLLVDDGAAVFLNGNEITRFSLGAGAVDNDLALTPVADSLQNTWRTFLIDPNFLLGGTNTLAIEVHTSSLADSDLRFDAQLIGVLAADPADLNGDGFVGQDDLNLILSNWGDSVPSGDPLQGDPSDDGFVGQDDLNLVLGSWGKGTPLVSAVPEPTSLALFAIGAIGGLALIARRRKFAA
ncbi:MAG: PEP-CTERM sorting domain-containing protein [Planctomycetota bacterium]|nr:PEP-CTERM sorting domain-containing protein [Planctomycetota bacterium]